VPARDEPLKEMKARVRTGGKVRLFLVQLLFAIFSRVAVMMIAYCPKESFTTPFNPLLKEFRRFHVPKSLVVS